MAGFVWPQDPEFAHESERRVFDALRRHLREGDALIYGLRFTDPTHGDVEVDFTVFLEGVGVAVVEAKGGRVTYSNGEWTTSSSTGTYRIHPTDQARKGMYALREALTSSGRWSRGPLRDAWLLALPDTEVFDDAALAPDAPLEVVIGRNHLDEALGRVFDRINDVRDERRVSAPGWIDSALEILLRRGEPQRDVIAGTAEREAHVERLTAEQGMVLDLVSDNQYVEVRGGAGTGKSWLAAEQARRWSAQGKRVAVLSFGRGLAETFSAQFVSTKRQHTPAFIGTFHQLGNTWGVVADRDAPPIWWTETAPELMAAAARELPDGKKFDALVVDEAQDFADNWWTPLLAALRDPENARIATFRDDNQAVFGRRGRPDLTFANVTLTKNLRNTKQIGEAFTPLVSDRRPQLLGGDGAPVTFIACATDEAVARADDAAVALLEEGWQPRDVVLLTTFHRHPVQRELQDEGFSEYWQNLWTGEDIFYATVAGFKGLERPAVVVAVDGFREGVDPRELLYVAMSRARDKLVVVGDPEVLRELGIRITNESGAMRGQ